MVIIHGYGAIGQDVQQLGIRAWSWSGDAGATVIESPLFCFDEPDRNFVFQQPDRQFCFNISDRS